MAKKTRKNSNYQTDVKKLAAAEKREKELIADDRRKKLPHKLSESEKKSAKQKSIRIICIILAVLMLLTCGTTAVYSLISSKTEKTAADYTYPPLYVYGGVCYMVTSDITYTRPEGDSEEELTAVTTGDQNSFPLSEGSCNFGGGTVPFLNVDGTIYLCTEEGAYLKCSVFDAGSSNDDTGSGEDGEGSESEAEGEENSDD